MKRKNIIVLKLKQLHKLDSGIDLGKWGPTQLEWLRIPSLLKSRLIALQRRKPKMFGKRGENGVSTQLVLSMRPYAHISWNHAKKG